MLLSVNGQRINEPTSRGTPRQNDNCAPIVAAHSEWLESLVKLGALISE